jgi:8-oxo-dGTP diphosphatase
MIKSDIYDYPHPFVTVDVILFSVINDDLKVLLIKRGKKPYKGLWAIPGGFVKINESLKDAAFRELEEETGLKEVYLEQLYTFGDVKRDPRGRVITITYFALVDSAKIKPIKKEKEIKDIMWHSVYNLEELAFDHKKILKYALERLRYKLEYTGAGFELLPKKFTLSDLQKIYEIILKQKLDKRNFIKKIKSMDILEKTNEFRKGAHRPAKLYKFKKGKLKSKFKKPDIKTLV